MHKSHEMSFGGNALSRPCRFCKPRLGLYTAAALSRATNCVRVRKVVPRPVTSVDIKAKLTALYGATTAHSMVKRRI